jgi:hypothetical protein
MVNKNAELFTDAEYKKHVRNLGDDYFSRIPRRVAGLATPRGRIGVYHSGLQQQYRYRDSKPASEE